MVENYFFCFWLAKTALTIFASSTKNARMILEGGGGQIGLDAGMPFAAAASQPTLFEHSWRIDFLRKLG
jgi:hypothetical protein